MEIIDSVTQQVALHGKVLMEQMQEVALASQLPEQQRNTG
jgi:hypothetical protein